MQIYLERDNKSVKLEFKGTVKELLKKLKVNPETVIVTKNNTLVTLDAKLADTDSVKILSVVSGG
jgi:sulfur carrier protein ThiS